MVPHSCHIADAVMKTKGYSAVVHAQLPTSPSQLKYASVHMDVYVRTAFCVSSDENLSG